jgi:hypothetical protein
MTGKHCVAALVGGLLASAAVGATVTFEDIAYWVGEGANEAALVIDFDGGPAPQSLVWGYRWDGTATGEDLFKSVVTADPNLYAKVSAQGDFGVSLYGIGYDQDRDGFALGDGTAFEDGLAITDPSDGVTAVDADDSYVEGWLSAGFWGHWTRDDDLTWASGLGMSARTLTDGDWDGYRWAPGYNSEPPREPVPAVPEPSALALLGLGLLLVRRR